MPRTGTIGMLIAAKSAGCIDNVRQALDELIATGIRISPDRYQESLRLAKG
jgi:predicted nucleic acid-binding protein